MNGARGFAANHFDDARMCMPERVDGDAAQEIQILFARGVESKRPSGLEAAAANCLVFGPTSGLEAILAVLLIMPP